MRLQVAVSLLLLALFAAPRAHAAEAPSQARAVVGAGLSQGTGVGSAWAPRTTYSVSLWGLWEEGQGVGARVSLLPPAPSTEAWEVSTDVVGRFTGEGPLYFKALGGAAFTPRPSLSPRLRAGGEVGLHAIRGSVGLEVGIAGVYAFPPSRFAQGEGVVSLGVGVLFGFGAPARAPALGSPPRAWAQQAAQNSGQAFQPWSLDSSLAPAGGAPPPLAERDVIQHLLLLRRPARVADWWNAGPWEDLEHWSHPLSKWERKYAEAMSAPTVPEPLRMGPLVTPERLTPEQLEDMEQRLGTGAAAAEGYSHWASRRRIVNHYYLTHPETVRVLVEGYGLGRDFNPLHFALERGWQMGSGEEMFTAREVSQLGAAGEFFTALAVGVAANKLMTATRPVPGWGATVPVPPGKVEAPPRAVARAPGPTAAPAPEPAPPALPSAPAAAAKPAPAPAPPAPAQAPLAPSPELVQALTGKNPTLRVPAGPRLPQDVTVKPKVPDLRKTDRSIGPSPRQNAQLQRDIEYLEKELGATNVRVNQQQLTFSNGQRVGINRPDLQFDYNDRRYSVEYDSPASGRGPGHQSRLTANDPEADVILIIILEK